MGTAEVLASMKKDLPGTVKFFFQPAEEGPPADEEGGAPLMIKEGVMENPKVDAVLGLHISSSLEIGKIKYKPGTKINPKIVPKNGPQNRPKIGLRGPASILLSLDHRSSISFKPSSADRKT